MKTDIHPIVRRGHRQVLVRQHVHHPLHQARASSHIELCNECHPFYTGKQKLVDSGGRVERFNKRYGARGTQVIAGDAGVADHRQPERRPPPPGRLFAVPALAIRTPTSSSGRSSRLRSADDGQRYC